MNAPLPEHVRKMLDAVTLDENPQSGFRRRHKYSGSEADCCVFVAELGCLGVAL